MNKDTLIELIEESIQLELNAAALYSTFADFLPEDNDFWWQLHIEERGHATLLRAARDSFAEHENFPKALLAGSIKEVREANAKIEAVIKQCRNMPPSRTEACEIAIELENDCSETHYNRFMEKEPDSAIERVFQQLNRTDKDHELRIRNHLDAIS